MLVHRGVSVVRLNDWWMFLFAVRDFRLNADRPWTTHALLRPSSAASQGYMLTDVLAMNKILRTSLVLNVSKGIFVK